MVLKDIDSKDSTLLFKVKKFKNNTVTEMNFHGLVFQELISQFLETVKEISNVLLKMIKIVSVTVVTKNNSN